MERFSQNEFVNTDEFRTLQKALNNEGKTLYQLEEEIVSSIQKGSL